MPRASRVVQEGPAAVSLDSAFRPAQAPRRKRPEMLAFRRNNLRSAGRDDRTIRRSRLQTRTRNNGRHSRSEHGSDSTLQRDRLPTAQGRVLGVQRLPARRRRRVACCRACCPHGRRVVLLLRSLQPIEGQERGVRVGGNLDAKQQDQMLTLSCSAYAALRCVAWRCASTWRLRSGDRAYRWQATRKKGSITRGSHAETERRIKGHEKVGAWEQNTA